MVGVGGAMVGCAMVGGAGVGCAMVGGAIVGGARSQSLIFSHYIQRDWCLSQM